MAKTVVHGAYRISLVIFVLHLSVCLFVQHDEDEHGRAMNISGAWRLGFTGKNVVVTILDDGIEKDHPDLVQNYVSTVGMRLDLRVCVCLLHVCMKRTNF
jgi:subtilisin family serine protease